MDFTVDDLLKEAQGRRASDLHITVGVSPKCRINGELDDLLYPALTPADTEELIIPIVPRNMRETLLNKGEVDFSYSIASHGRYRVNVYKQRGSYAAAIRIINTNIPSPNILGIPPSVVGLTKKKRGMVLVTGPTGSGKSTTLASLIDIINTSRNLHVITLEDPIEYLHRHKKSIVNQREIGIDSLSFSNALRVILREDPDVILVGEMRDLETISIAMTAAETGHLVLSTLHTLGAAKTIDRIIDVFPPNQQHQIRMQLSTILKAVISQQLLPSEKRGRAAAFEIMTATNAIQNLIRENKTYQIDSVIHSSKNIGMQSMDMSISELYKKGYITRESALLYSLNPDVLIKYL